MKINLIEQFDLVVIFKVQKMFFHLDMLFKWLIRFRLKHNNLSRYLHEKCFLMTYKSVNKYFDFIICISYFSFSHFFSVSGRVSFIRILVWIFYLNKASGELLDPDHYTRARNNPPIPPQALGKIFFFVEFYQIKIFSFVRSSYIKTYLLKSFFFVFYAFGFNRSLWLFSNK